MDSFVNDLAKLVLNDGPIVINEESEEEQYDEAAWR